MESQKLKLQFELEKITKSQEFKKYILNKCNICPNISLEVTDKGYLICERHYENGFGLTIVDMYFCYITGINNPDKYIEHIKKYFKENTNNIIDASLIYYDINFTPNVWR